MNITTSATSLVSIRLVERTHSWLAAFGKLRTRFERRIDVHVALLSLAEAAKKHKVSDATIYAWRKHFGQMEAADVKRQPALRTGLQEQG